VALAVSMEPGRDVIGFAEALRAQIPALGAGLPAGFALSLVTDQGAVVRTTIDGVLGNLWQTLAVVMLVTLAALGARAGPIVGLSLPVTILATLAVLRPLGVEMNQVTAAAFIIALGALVDNANVVVDDTVRRIGEGFDRAAAAREAGDRLATPLLVATLTTILAFAPPVFTDNLAVIYMQELTIVMAVTLAVSWLASITVIPLMAARLAPRPSAPAPPRAGAAVPGTPRGLPRAARRTQALFARRDRGGPRRAACLGRAARGCPPRGRCGHRGLPRRARGRRARRLAARPRPRRGRGAARRRLARRRRRRAPRQHAGRADFGDPRGRRRPRARMAGARA
jgi:multidrug efflux pump subunit AcrB